VQVVPAGARVPSEQHTPRFGAHRPSPQFVSVGAQVAPELHWWPSARQPPCAQQTGVAGGQEVPSPQHSVPAGSQEPAQHTSSRLQHAEPQTVCPIRHMGGQSAFEPEVQLRPSPQHVGSLVGQQFDGPQPGPAMLPSPHAPQVASPAVQHTPFE